MLIKDRNHKNKVYWFKKVQYFIKVKFRRLLAVIGHCQARIDFKIWKHYLNRFGRYCVLSTYSALSLVFSTNVVCVKTQQKTCQYQKYNQLKNMIQWHVFISVPQHYNPYSGNFARRASSPTRPTTIYNPYSANLPCCEGFGHASTH